MASRLVVLIAALAACQAGPIWFSESDFPPGTVFIREGRAPDFAAPSIAYGFGSGFSSNIGGISHNTGIGASFQTGNAQASGSGIAGSDGNVFARGVGYANANPAPQPIYRTSYPFHYAPYNGLRRNYENNYGTAVSSAQNIGNYGNAVAQTHNSPYGSSATAVQNGGRYQSITSAQNHRGLGYGSSASSAASNGFGSTVTSSSDGFGTAISSAQNRDAHGGTNSAVSASQIVGGVRASTAQTVQQHGGVVQQSGASSIDGPGIQASHTHAIKTGYY